MRLLDARLEQLEHAPFFRDGLHDYLISIRDVIAKIEENFSALPPELIRMLTRQVWIASRYLSGSVSREIPYEVVYGLDLALTDWVTQPSPYIVTTAFLSEQNYHFEGVPEQFYDLCKATLNVEFEQRVVQIALPQLYKHLPLNNTVLYHELGHFVDERHAISRLMAIMDTAAGVPVLQTTFNHAAEYFADLFAACYVGNSVAFMIEAMAPGAAVSTTHPSTVDRSKVVKEFLANESNSIVDLCNAALSALKLPTLTPKFSEPVISEYFDNVRPYDIKSKSEIHGLLLAGQKYLVNRIENLDGRWENLSEGEAIRTANDLIEKSLRNWMVKEKWQSVSSP